MTSRIAAAIALAVVLAAGIAFVATQRGNRDTAVVRGIQTPAVPPPPGVNPARWFPLGPSSGVALHPESQATSPDSALSGDLWVIVDGHWHIVRLPAMPPPESRGTVPAASAIPSRSFPALS